MTFFKCSYVLLNLSFYIFTYFTENFEPNWIIFISKRTSLFSKHWRAFESDIITITASQKDSIKYFICLKPLLAFVLLFPWILSETWLGAVFYELDVCLWIVFTIVFFFQRQPKLADGGVLNIFLLHMWVQKPWENLRIVTLTN